MLDSDVKRPRSVRIAVPLQIRLIWKLMPIPKLEMSTASESSKRVTDEVLPTVPRRATQVSKWPFRNTVASKTANSPVLLSQFDKNQVLCLVAQNR